MLVKYGYTVAKQKDGNLLVTLVDFPTGVTEAANEAEAQVFAKEIAEGLIEAYQEDGLDLPKASPVGNNKFVEVTV